MSNYSIVTLSARILIYSFALAAMLGCSTDNKTASAGATATPVARNAGSTTITVEGANDARLAHALVALSSSLDGTDPAGTIYAEEITPLSGQVSVKGLPSTGSVCVSAAERFYQSVAECHQPFESAYTVVLAPVPNRRLPPAILPERPVRVRPNLLEAPSKSS